MLGGWDYLILGCILVGVGLAMGHIKKKKGCGGCNGDCGQCKKGKK